MAHAILPGAAVGFLLYGLQIVPMTIGGLVAGVIVALGAGAVSRFTIQKEDASMAAFYLISLALGVLIVSLRGSNVDLMHVLFGTVLALNNEALSLIGMISAISVVTLAIFWRGLVAECLDPLFLRSVSRIGTPVHFIFLALVVINLVGGFQALGTLLAVGLMMLPAAAARFWTSRVGPDVRAGHRHRLRVLRRRACWYPTISPCRPGRPSSSPRAQYISAQSSSGITRHHQQRCLRPLSPQNTALKQQSERKTAQ